MRVNFMLLMSALAVLVSENAVSGSNIKLQDNTHGLQLTEADETDTDRGRFLRTHVTPSVPDDEERGIEGLTKILGGVKPWMREFKLKEYVKYQSMFVDQEATIQKFLRKNIHPDQVKKWLKVDKERKTYWFDDFNVRPERTLWEKYDDLYKSKHG